MATTADDLKADIERRRERMADTVDEIEDRTTPSRIVQRRREAMRGGAARTRIRVMGTGPVPGARTTGPGLGDRMSGAAHDAAEWVGDVPEQMGARVRGAPLVAGGIAFGVGALLALVLPATDTARQVLEPLAPSVGRLADSTKDSARQAMDATREAASDAADHLSSEMSERSRTVGEQVAGAVQGDGPGTGTNG